MKINLLVLSFVLLTLFLTLKANSSEKYIKVSLNGGVNWKSYASMNDFSSDLFIETNKIGTRIFLSTNNKKYSYDNLKNAFNNIRIQKTTFSTAANGNNQFNIHDTANPIITAFPNPFNEVINIKFNNEGCYQIVIFDDNYREFLNLNQVVAKDETLTLPVEFITTKNLPCYLLIYKGHKIIFSKLLIKTKK
jgi:hypothetical protein